MSPKHLAQSNQGKVTSWKSVDLSTGEIKPPPAARKSKVKHSGKGKISLKFSSSVLIQGTIYV